MDARKKNIFMGLALLVLLGVFIYLFASGKPAGSYFQRYVRPRTWRGRTDYDRYISCISEGGYWLDGTCSTVNLPGSQSLQPTPPFLYGYYNNYPYYYFPTFAKRHRYYPRRRYQKRYGRY